jgi:DNA-binding IclR family transcriptional regulator
MALGSVAQPMMQRLRDATSETVSLFVPDGAFRLCIAELESPQPLSFRRGVGYREKLVLGASGRSILAHMDLSGAELKAYASDRAFQVRKYEDELAQIRRRGYAISRDELIQGAVAVAAPFFTRGKVVAGSLSIFGPSVRMTTAAVGRCSRLLREETRKLSAALGHADPA